MSSDTGGPLADENGITSWFTTVNAILPAGRVNWLLEQEKRTHMTVTGVSLWLDHYWLSSAANALAMVDTEFYLSVYKEDAALLAGQYYEPFGQPILPTAMTNWASEPSDGLDPFMWRHWVKGASGPNAGVDTNPAGFQGNRYTATNGVGAIVSRTQFVVQDWQPQVRVKTRRRLDKNAGIIFGMRNPQATKPSPASVLQCQVLVYGA